MYTPKLGELQSILVSASRCLDCADPRCVELCPEHVDVRAAMRLVMHQRESALRNQGSAQNSLPGSGRDGMPGLHVDALVLARPGSADRTAWVQRADEATASAMSAIEASFE